MDLHVVPAEDLVRLLGGGELGAEARGGLVQSGLGGLDQGLTLGLKRKLMLS